MKSVMFKNCGGVHVPLQPWPQFFYVSRELFDIKALELRPLTLTGLVKGVGKNLVTMNFWRLCYLLHRAGFLRTPEGQMFSIHDWTWKFWKPQPPRQLVGTGSMCNSGLDREGNLL